MLAALPIAALAFTSAPTLTRSGALVTRSPTPVAAIDVNSLDQQQVAIIGGAVLALGGAIAYGKQNEDGSTASAPSPPKPAKSTPPARKPVARAKPKGWGLGNYGKSKAPHPMAGPWPKAPKREEWVPPEGWEPPKKPVQSWYDRGERLKPPAPPPAAAPTAPAKPTLKSFLDSLFGGFDMSPAGSASTAKGWGLGNYGKSKAPHPSAGPWPKAPKREEWVPPEGWAPPSMPPKVVIESWYDSGMRLRDDGVVVPSGADSSSEMTVAQACAFFAANPSIDAAEKKAFLLSKGVSDFVIAQAECTATGMEKSVAGHP